MSSNTEPYVSDSTPSHVSTCVSLAPSWLSGGRLEAPVDNADAERAAIIWSDTPAADGALTLIDFPSPVQPELAPDQHHDCPRWEDLPAVEPPPCEQCGSLEAWQSYTGTWHCMTCQPATASRRLVRDVGRILRREARRLSRG